MAPTRVAATFAALAVPLLAAALPPELGVLQYQRTIFGMEKGLPSPNVTAIVPARDGRLWIGTQSGVAAFDGTSFEVLDGARLPDLPGDLTSDNGVVEDAAGDLWIALYDGHLLRLRGGPGGTLDRLLEPTGAISLGLWRVGDDVWLGRVGGGVRFSEGRGPPRPFGPADGLPGGITGMGADGGGRVYAATEHGLRVLEGDRFVRPAPEVEAALGGDGPVGGVSVARSGGVWVTAPGRAVRVGPDGRVADRVGPGPGVPEGWPLRVLEDRDGILWLGAAGGLSRAHAGRIAGPFGAPDVLPSTRVDMIGEDPEGGLWLGLYGAGLVRLRAPDATLLGRREGLQDDEVMSVVAGAGGEIWVGAPSGLYVIRKGRATRAAPAVAGDVTVVAVDASGTPWVNSGRVICRLAGGRLEPVATAPARVNALRFDRDGALWVGAVPGLFRLRDGRLEVPPGAEPLASDRINALEVAPDGTFWVLGEVAGPLRRTADGFTAGAPGGWPASTPLASLHVDGDGTLWLGTSSAGLWRLR
jgi:ligand-binding sensor domain-containing protein